MAGEGDIAAEELDPATERAALASLLAYYVSIGVDAALEDAPVDRFAETAEMRTRREERASMPAAPAAPRSAPSHAPPAGYGPGPGVPPAEPEEVMAARAAAAEAETLDALRAVLEGFEGCGLKRTARSLCFADGNPAARVMFVGEAPGREEDAQGLPFVGRSGQLLDRMLAAIGLSRDDVYIANTVPWRPPGNRTPTPEEKAVCRPFIARQIALVAPAVLVPLGGAAAKELFDTSEGILRQRGRVRDMEMGGAAMKGMATLHPAYLLRQPAQKRLAWNDLRTLKRLLDEAG
jgi:DNA polymerase